MFAITSHGLGKPWHLVSGVNAFQKHLDTFTYGIDTFIKCHKFFIFDFLLSELHSHVLMNRNILS